MNVELKLSELMTSQRENDIIRVTPLQRISLDVQLGGRLTITSIHGVSLSLLVKEAHPVDTLKSSSSSYVSQKTLDDVTGDSSRPLVVTLGCDPEFVFLDSHRKVFPASHWLPTWGPIGSDGPLAELRPLPATHEEGVVDNLRKLITKLPPLVNAKFGSNALLRPEAHSCWQTYALGFHIHLGAPRELLTFAAPNTKEFIETMVTAMDFFVGIPAMLLEDTNVRRLGDGMYGNPGDYRVSSKTIEYRTPGGFHLRHPSYAEGIMGLALCVGEEFLNKYRYLSNNWKNLDKVSAYSHARKRFNLPERREIRLALQDPTKVKAVRYLPTMLKTLQRFDSFKEHRNSISRYFGLLLDNTQYSSDMLQNW